MTRILMGIAAALMMLFSVSAFADDRDFVLINGTGYDIKFLGVNAPGDENWNDNELSGVLNDGAQFKVKFSGADKGCSWNIKVTWTDNSWSLFRGLDLCTINTVTLKYNRNTDTASYVTD